MTEPIVECTVCGQGNAHRDLKCSGCSTVGVPFLYKYRPYNDYTKQGLRDRTLWFPSVGALNDPFEFSFALKQMTYIGIPIDPTSLEQARRDMKRFGVLSVSEVENNILMWAHYAAAHSGLCLKFERSEATDFGSYGKCLPVIYDHVYPELWPVELKRQASVSRLMTAKSQLWSYEREWRRLCHEGDVSHPYPGPLRGIIFGCRMEPESRREVVEIVGTEIEYFEAVVSGSRFELEIRPLVGV